MTFHVLVREISYLGKSTIIILRKLLSLTGLIKGLIFHVLILVCEY